jgi:SAM-dependent methyltransferase
LRHEDVTQLTFDDGQFDQVLSFDVLEHVPNAQNALKELSRILRRHGTLLLTAPFDVSARKNLQRASVSDLGEITHFQTAEYHGDPVNPSEGILCYWWFGWEILDQLREVGFSDAAVFFCWSAEAGYLGPPSPFIVAQR